MAEKVGILDLNFMTYTYHSTPQASMYTMLISGWHKAKGNNVLLLDEFPNPVLFDKIYIVRDRRGLDYIPRWLGYPNVVPVGNHWEKSGVVEFYNEAWESAPPDNTIYWGWLENWTNRYPKYNAARLAHFYLQPVKIKRNGKVYWPEGEGFLILDNDMVDWDPAFEGFMQNNIKNSRFAYPIPIDNRWEEVLTFLELRQLSREYLFLEMDIDNYEQDTDFQEAADIWLKHSPGRMPRLLLNVECYTDEQWTEVLPKVYKCLEIFRMTAKKKLRVQPFGKESFSHPRIIQELKRWSGSISGGYSRNSLFDYILFDSVRDTESLKLFLNNPYDYVKRKRNGSNKLGEVIDFIEKRPELFEVILKSYPKGAN